MAQATEWIRNSLTFEKDRYVNLFETTIRTLGGLLSAYHLTGDTVCVVTLPERRSRPTIYLQMFVEKAEDLAERLLGAFTSSKSNVPLSDVNLKTRYDGQAVAKCKAAWCKIQFSVVGKEDRRSGAASRRYLKSHRCSWNSGIFPE